MLRQSLMILLLLGGLAAASPAQPGGGPRALTDSATIERRASDLSALLGLSAEQSEAVREIFFEQGAKARQAMAGGDRETMRQALRAAAQESDRRIEELLTEEQKEVYRVHREQRRREMRRRFEDGERVRP